jgi:hypothetical protein
MRPGFRFPCTATLRRSFAQRHELSQTMRNLALGRIPSPAGVNIAALCPDEDSSLESTTTSFKAIYGAAIRYGRNTLQAFGRDPSEFVLPLPSI